ncbi:hypothetical protein OQA88_7125 [Cercophora sp. LCS_1]
MNSPKTADITFLEKELEVAPAEVAPAEATPALAPSNEGPVAPTGTLVVIGPQGLVVKVEKDGKLSLPNGRKLLPGHGFETATRRPVRRPDSRLWSEEENRILQEQQSLGKKYPEYAVCYFFSLLLPVFLCSYVYLTLFRDSEEFVFRLGADLVLLEASASRSYYGSLSFAALAFEG